MTSTTRTTSFSSEQDEHLIELVAQQPSLYDSKLESYKDGLQKIYIWKDIGNALNKTSDDCKKRWKHIKDSYNRYKRKRKTGRAALPKTSKWEFYERLKFLELASSLSEENQNESMGNEDNDSDKNDDSDKDHDDSHSAQSMIVNEIEYGKNASRQYTKQNANNTESVSKQSMNKAKKAAASKKETHNAEFIQYMKERDEQRQALLKQAYDQKVEKSIEDDDVNSFGEHIKSVLKKLPPILKVQAKAEIFSIMSKYELMSVETTASTSSMSNYTTYY